MFLVQGRGLAFPFRNISRRAVLWNCLNIRVISGTWASLRHRCVSLFLNLPRRSKKNTDMFNKLTQDLFGYSTYGYWPWHNTDDAVKTCDENVCCLLLTQLWAVAGRF